MTRILAFLALISLTASAAVVTSAAPPGELLASDYRVEAGDQRVDVYTARVLDPPFAGKEWDYGGNYCFANLDTDGAVEIRISSPRVLTNTVVRPESAGVTLRLLDEHTIILSLPGPRLVSVEPEGRRAPLLLFANPPEPTPPKAGDPGVIYFGPGIHKPGRIVVTNDQTLYLAGGAVVHGGVLAEGNNFRIIGRGILDSSDYEWRHGPTPHVVSIRGTNVEVSGITIRGASHWTLVPRDSRNVRVQGIKICGGRVQNDDGINPCNSSEVRITGCFIRSDDDCVAMKGLVNRGEASNVERVTVEDCVLWCDRARIFLLGHESRAPFMRNLTLRNLDIIHFTMTPFLFEPGEEMRLENVLVENVRLNSQGQRELIRLKPVVNQYMQTKVPGHIRDVHFRNVSVSGAPGPYLVQLSGADREHRVENITFEAVTVAGERLARESKRIVMGADVQGVEFDPGPK